MANEDSNVPTGKQSPQVQDFLNPKAAITLTASSAMVVGFTTTLNSAFGWPMAWIALGLSAVFASVQIGYLNAQDRWFTKPAYFVIVMLIIFNSARGGSGTLSKLGSQEAPAPIVALYAPPPFLPEGKDFFPPMASGVPLAPSSTETTVVHSATQKQNNLAW